MSKGFVYILIITVGVLIGSIVFILLKKQDLLYRLQLKLDKIKKVFLYIVEWILYLCVIYFFLNFLTIYYYQNIFPISSLIFLVVFISIFVLYFLILFDKNKSSIHNLFVLFAIPVGLTFLFFVLPDFVPDEPSHFQRAYSVSNFNLTSSIHVMIDSDYAAKKLTNYSQILPSIYFTTGPVQLEQFHEACSYNFILYIFPALAINIGKLINLSLYGCYYLGRMANLILYIVFGYASIKITPKLKWMFFVFLFNPMLLHLAGSYSSDVIIDGVCVLSLAYFLYLYFDKETIDTKDIVIVISMIFIMLIAKYAFLPLFGIYFLVIPKLIKISKKQWAILVICICFGMSFYLLHTYLASFGETIPSQEIYYTSNNVNASEQINYLLSNPTNIVTMYARTFYQEIDYYFENFVSKLGWLEIDINAISYYLFYIILFFTICLEKVKLSIGNRIWFFILALIVAAIIVLGLYLYWAPVGWPVSAGVQGRYFVPCALLILTSISNGLATSFKYKREVIILSILIIDILALKDILVYFL